MKRLQLLIFGVRIFVTSGFSLKLHLLQSLHENGSFQIKKGFCPAALGVGGKANLLAASEDASVPFRHSPKKELLVGQGNRHASTVWARGGGAAETSPQSVLPHGTRTSRCSPGWGGLGHDTSARASGHGTGLPAASEGAASQTHVPPPHPSSTDQRQRQPWLQAASSRLLSYRPVQEQRTPSSTGNNRT